MKALKLKKLNDKEPVFTEKAAKAYLKFMQGVADGRKRDAEKLIIKNVDKNLITNHNLLKV